MNEPLAHRMRPQHISECVGQPHLFSPNGLFRKLLEAKKLPSLIFYGPSGVGKTTAAHALVHELGRSYELFNAAINNKKQLEDIIKRTEHTQGFVLIMDEVHRMNKDKQDYLLPFIENGQITLIGCTSANPTYSINPAIRSRALLIPFYPITHNDIVTMLQRSMNHPKGLVDITADDDAITLIATKTNFDIRLALNTLELCATLTSHIDCVTVNTVLTDAMQSGFKDDDGFYDLLSAFQKSIRGSDADASLYYLARLIKMNDLDAILRRLVVTAYEDVGLANPPLVARVVQACDVAQKIGLPEARIILANAVIECATSIKSTSAISAIDDALSITNNESHVIPPYLTLTPVGLAQTQKYNYSNPNAWVHYGYLPEAIAHKQFYKPTSLSPFEKVIYENYTKLSSIKRFYHLEKIEKDPYLK